MHFLIEFVYGDGDFQRQIPADKRGHAQVEGKADRRCKHLGDSGRLAPLMKASMIPALNPLWR